jgi:hypothetical protein
VGIAVGDSAGTNWGHRPHEDNMIALSPRCSSSVPTLDGDNEAKRALRANAVSVIPSIHSPISSNKILLWKRYASHVDNPSP